MQQCMGAFVPYVAFELVAVERLRRHEVVRRLADRGVQVWTGRADPMSAGSPFAILAQAVRRGIGVRGWNEPVLGAALASITALACQVAATRS